MTESTNDPHAGPSHFFNADHQRCDALWAEVEAAADKGEAPDTQRAWREFDAALRRHLELEEQILFPALEDAMNMHGGGPTQVMRMEHRQMRGLLDQMQGAAERADLDGLIDGGDTLLMLIQQHNQKEEMMLYPMADRALGAAWAPLADRIAAFRG